MSFPRPFFGGNWKMHHGPDSARDFVGRFVELYPPRDDRTIVIFPPAISVTAFREAALDRTDLSVGVQDVYWEEQGAYTGAVSAGMAREAGARFVLAGHSERRHVFEDSDEEVARKVAAILRAGLAPVLCVGETLEQRERGEVEPVVSRQLDVGLSLAGDGMPESLVIAYEPVWAIGTGRTARAEDASEVHGLIRDRLAERAGREDAGAVPILYGGSVKPGNIEDLLAAPEVDGVLVGGASLDPESFAAICEAG